MYIYSFRCLICVCIYIYINIYIKSILVDPAENPDFIDCLICLKGTVAFKAVNFENVISCLELV